MADGQVVDTQNRAWKDDKTSFGFRMMKKMGWKEDKGLGKDETGIVASVKIKKREDGLGLGMEQATDEAGNRGWSETATSFNAVLDLLKASYGKSDKKKSKRKRTSASEAPAIVVGMKYVCVPLYHS